MALTNAEHQALWRKRQKEKLKQGQDLYVRATKPLVDALKAEGRKNMATMVPATVAYLAALLERLNRRWPHLSPETRAELASAVSVQDLTRLLPPLT
jgi:hypothetical protein